MSQAGIVDFEGSNPQVPTSFVANVGIAVPLANVLEILGTTVPSHAIPLQTTASGNTVTIQAQYSSASASSVAANAGFASFNSTSFSVDANGFVSFVGGGGFVTSVSGTANRITSTGGTTPVIDIAATYVGQTSITTVGTITTGVWQGTTVGATFGGTGQSTYATGDILYASAPNTLSKLPASTNGFVLTLVAGVPAWVADGGGTVTSVSGTLNRITSTGGTTPVIDIAATYVGQASITTLGTITTGVWNGTTVAATFGGTGQNTYTTGDILYASAANTLSKLPIGATGTVLTVAGGIPSWAASGVFSWIDTSGSFSPTAGNGYFITGTATANLPASPSQGDTIQFFVDHASQVLTIDAPGTQLIRLGSLVSSAGGTAVSTLQGDSVELVYRASNTCWCAVSGFSGTWVIT